MHPILERVLTPKKFLLKQRENRRKAIDDLKKVWSQQPTHPPQPPAQHVDVFRRSVRTRLREALLLWPFSTARELASKTGLDVLDVRRRLGEMVRRGEAVALGKTQGPGKAQEYYYNLATDKTIKLAAVRKVA